MANGFRMGSHTWNKNSLSFFAAYFRNSTLAIRHTDTDRWTESTCTPSHTRAHIIDIEWAKVSGPIERKACKMHVYIFVFVFLFFVFLRKKKRSISRSSSSNMNSPVNAKNETINKKIDHRPRIHHRVNMTSHWKLLTFMIGGNDFCSDICYQTNATQWMNESQEKYLIKTLRFLRDNMPRLVTC